MKETEVQYWLDSQRRMTRMKNAVILLMMATGIAWGGVIGLGMLFSMGLLTLAMHETTVSLFMVLLSAAGAFFFICGSVLQRKMKKLLS